MKIFAVSPSELNRRVQLDSLKLILIFSLLSTFFTPLSYLPRPPQPTEANYGENIPWQTPTGVGVGWGGGGQDETVCVCMCVCVCVCVRVSMCVCVRAHADACSSALYFTI